MTTQAIYNKWRGQSFEDILGQEHITRTLHNQIQAGRIGHAYLFTGLRGTGKTSTARILAKAVNCIGETDNPPCNQCHICQSITSARSLDLIEIDAASNRGIDEIRDLRDRVAFAPHETRFKVYVIDEVHMLTNEAFNALLKTLEEPPSHVIFILCTTEPHRLPDTILSRCQRFDFRRGKIEDIAAKLRRICEAEGISISSQALALIARRGSGSFRDAESLLDQLAAYGSQEIDEALVEQVLGTVPAMSVLSLVESVVVGDVSRGLRIINQEIENGAEPRQFLSEILDQLRALLLLRVDGASNIQQLGPQTLAEIERIIDENQVSPGLLVKALRLFNGASQGLRYAERPQLPFELALIETVLSMGQSVPEAEATPSEPVSRPRSNATAAAAPRPSVAPVVAEEQVSPFTPKEPVSAEDVTPQVATSPRTATPLQDEALVELPSPAPDGPLREEDRARDAGPAPSRGDNESAPAEGIAEIQSMAKPEQPPGLREELPEPASEPESTSLSIEWVQNNWNLALTKIRPRSHQIRALLNSAYPTAVRDNLITLSCEATFHRDMLTEDKRRELVETVLSEVLGAPCRVQCQLGDATPVTQSKVPDSNPQQMFERPDPEQVRQRLQNHPVVKELERRGGRISRISVAGEDDLGG